MPIVIKAGLWKKVTKMLDGELNLNQLISSLIPIPVPGNLPYKSYVALLTQNGTTAPVATVLENSLGGPVSFTYGSLGFYSATSAGLFTLNKTAVLLSPSAGNSLTIAKPVSVSSITILSQSSTTAGFVDNNLQGSMIEIRVYN